MSTDRRKMTGRAGEDAAAAYLIREGYRMIERNWRCRTGEIDIIAARDRQLIFVEVRTRSTTGSFGSALESVDPRKQAQVRRTAEVYLHRQRMDEATVQFDVIAVQMDEQRQIKEIRHIRQAF